MENLLKELPKAKERKYVSKEFKMDSWQDLEPYINDLKSRELNSLEELEKWILQKDEFETVISEDIRWRMIKMTCDTTDPEAQNAYAHVIQNITPNLMSEGHLINEKMLACPFLNDLDQDYYFIFLRGVKAISKLFRPENIALFTDMKMLSKEFGAITGKMMVEIDGQMQTLQQANKLLQSSDREVRKSTYIKIAERRLEDKEALNDVFDKLVKLRHKVAVNSGFENFRDYSFVSMGRFDYSPEECFEFHDSIATEISPLVDRINKRKKERLGFSDLFVWDLDAPEEGESPLRPFQDSKQLVAKTIDCLKAVKPEFGRYLQIMDQMGYLDLDSRKGKSPGGYNCSLPEIGVPFIFMNSVGTLRDLTTMVHEAGHAIHTFLTRDLDLMAFKSVPSEIAELASMAMELISMEHWDVFFNNEADLRKAKIIQLEKVLSSLPWIARVDKFQHWLYSNPNHSQEERSTYWTSLNDVFGSSTVKYGEIEQLIQDSWQKQLHLFEVPFYYIEYAMAQLGSIALWKQYKLDGPKALHHYQRALSLGYTKPIGEVYEAANVRFAFNKEYVKELGNFVMDQLEGLYKEEEEAILVA